MRAQKKRRGQLRLALLARRDCSLSLRPEDVCMYVINVRRHLCMYVRMYVTMYICAYVCLINIRTPRYMHAYMYINCMFGHVFLHFVLW